MLYDMTPQPGPDGLMQIATGYMAAKHLFAASELGLFTALGTEARPLEELAAELAMPLRTARMSADAMVALGLVEKSPAGYWNSPVTEAFLSGRTPADLRPALRLFDKLSYVWWEGLEGALRAGSVTGGIKSPTEAEQRIYSEGVEAITAGTALALASSYDFGRHGRLIDLGGGTGSFVATICDAHPGLRCALFELPAVATIASAQLAKKGHEGRVEVISGDFFATPVPAGYDAFLVANIVHNLPPARNRVLLERIRHSAAAGATLLLVDFWTDATHTDPPFAALMAGEFLLSNGEGDVYSVAEVGEWLHHAGWRIIAHEPLAGPASLVVAEAI